MARPIGLSNSIGHLFFIILEGACIVPRAPPRKVVPARHAPQLRHGLFAMIPYGKFDQGLYRTAALLKAAIGKRLANRVRAGDS